MGIDIEVSANIDLVCNDCGKDIEASQNTYARSSYYGKVGVDPCDCKTNEISELKQKIDDLNCEIDSLNEIKERLND